VERVKRTTSPRTGPRQRINQVRCQMADWRAGGLRVGSALEEIVRNASSAFGQAVLQADERPRRHYRPGGVDPKGTQAADPAFSRFIYDQVFEIRHQRPAAASSPAWVAAWGADVSPGRVGRGHLSQTFNLVGIPSPGATSSRATATSTGRRRTNSLTGQ